MLRGSWILRLFPYERAARIQDQSSRFYFPTPSLRLSVRLSFHKDSALGPRPSGPPWALDSGCWILESVGGWGAWRALGSVEGSGPLGIWILESVGGWVGCVCGPLDSVCWNLWCVGGVGRCGPPGFCILDSGNWAVRWTEGCGPPRFCILYSGNWAVGGRVDGLSLIHI